MVCMFSVSTFPLKETVRVCVLLRYETVRVCVLLRYETVRVCVLLRYSIVLQDSRPEFYVHQEIIKPISES